MEVAMELEKLFIHCTRTADHLEFINNKSVRRKMRENFEMR